MSFTPEAYHVLPQSLAMPSPAPPLSLQLYWSHFSTHSQSFWPQPFCALSLCLYVLPSSYVMLALG